MCGDGRGGRTRASRGRRPETRRAALGPFRRRERRNPRLHSRPGSLACHLELCFKVASGRLLSAAPSRRRSLRGRGVGWGEGTGSSVGDGKAARPACACACALTRGEAREVCVQRPRAPWRGRVLSPPAGSRRVCVRKRLGSRGCEKGRFAPCGGLHLPADRWRVTLFGGNSGTRGRRGRM